MAEFDDMSDPTLAAACNRLAAFCEALPAGIEIDQESGLTEPDLVMVLRHVHSTRSIAMFRRRPVQEMVDRVARVPTLWPSGFSLVRHQPDPEPEVNAEPS